MKPLSSLRVRVLLVLTVFGAIAPVFAVMLLFDLPAMGYFIPPLALIAAWFGGDYFIVRQARDILDASRRLEAGDLTSRTREAKTGGELGELASAFDQMAESIEARARQSQAAERALINRAQQQTVVAALEQFALVSPDFNALVNQAVTMVAQTLELEFTHVLVLQPDGKTLFLQAGNGWKTGCVGQTMLDAGEETQVGWAVKSGGPVVIDDFGEERRFAAPPLLVEHEIRSGVAVVISTRKRPYGVLGAFAPAPRKYTGAEVSFLVSVATALGLAVERGWTDMELQRVADFAELNPNPALEFNADGSISYFNEATSKLAQSVGCDQPGDALPADVAEIVKSCLDSGLSRVRCETKVQGRTISWSFHPMADNRVVHCYGEDITDRLNLEAQLRQSQKMESVGQLAAGVAHDFNNMLTIIQGHAGIMLSRKDAAPGTAESIQAIHFASERAAALTRQLLVFSRKNVIQRRLLSLSEVVGNMSKMVRRMLGETIKLQFEPPRQLPLVFGDAGMIEQVLMNLIVNARDAMPKGGSLTLELAPLEITPALAEANADARPGSFVCLRVTDTGTGMDAATLSRIFEPFFTTKEVGKGTGLGLATVYGIVKQHDGWIQVESQPGQGTTFSVFLPARLEIEPAARPEVDPAASPSGGQETILVVEDEPVVRDLATIILQECGYKIFCAGTGREALEVWEREAGRFDLLLSDMVMPEGMSGAELAEQLCGRQPLLKVLFASGYTMDDVSESFLKKHNAKFLQKPYTSLTLATAVRQALDGLRPAGRA